MNVIELLKNFTLSHLLIGNATISKKFSSQPNHFVDYTLIKVHYIIIKRTKKA